MSQMDKLNFLGEVKFEEAVKFAKDVEVTGSLKKDGKEILTGADLSAPDWNQNDPAASDYIKNRTHYSILANIEKEETVEPMWYNGYLYQITYDAPIKIKDLPLKTLIKYEIWSEGSLLLSGELLKTKDSRLVGNQWLSNPEGGYEDSGEDVAIYDINNSVIAFRYAETLESCVIKIAYDGIIQLDEKYIPTALHSDLNNNSLFQKDTKAISAKSAAFGFNTQAGSFAYTVTALDPVAKTFTLDSVEGLEVDDIYTVDLSFYRADGTATEEIYTNYGKITAISADNVVTVDTFPSDVARYRVPDEPYIDENGLDGEENVFRVIAKPNVGNRAIGTKSFATGNSSQALSKNSVAMGKACIAYGAHSVAIGYDNKTTYAATSFGRSNTASGVKSVAIGYNNTSSGEGSIAFGNSNTSSNKGSFASGTINKATGTNSFAAGHSNKAQGKYSIALGYNNTSSGEGSIAFGNSNTASNKGSFASGTSNNATGTNSFALGSTNRATGTSSFAHGYNNDATQTGSAVFGTNSKSQGESSFAAGAAVEASGHYSQAFGQKTKAIGACSFAEGKETIANGKHQHVQGKYNIEDTENRYAHIVGNGTDNGNRSNAHTLDWKGNAWFAGNITAANIPEVKIYKVYGLQPGSDYDGFSSYYTHVSVKPDDMILIDLDPNYSEADDYSVFAQLVCPKIVDKQVSLLFPQDISSEYIDSLSLTICVISVPKTQIYTIDHRG